MSWTDERVEKLKDLWAEGMSASQIARSLGGVTRNAVIGKVHRLGLSNRTGGAEDGTDKPGAKTARAAMPEGDMDETVETASQPAPVEPEPEPEPEQVAAPEIAEQASEPEPVALPIRTAPVVRDASQPRAPGLPTPEEEAARATLVQIEKMARRLNLLDLTERTCKWPIGDPTDEAFHFCGLPTVTGKPYCEHHVAVAFQPMSTRRDRARAGR